MDQQQIKDLLRAIGISSGIVIFVLIIGAVFLFYRNFLEAEKLKLEITLLQKEVLNPGSTSMGPSNDDSYRGITEIRTLERTAPAPQYAPNKYEKFRM